MITFAEFGLFLIGQKQGKFLKSVPMAHLAADFKIHVKVMDNHFMCDCGACFSRAIMSSLCTLCCLLSVKWQKHDFYFFAQSIIIEGVSGIKS